jgi:DNA (cytosine-5)-methyltransferase 1
MSKGSTRPRLLDLFCGAGGAAMGYHRAGFDVVGVDIRPQPRYPFEFHQGDAMTWPLDEGCDAIHASPPCQAYSPMRNMPTAREHPELLDPVRARLVAWGGPSVIENVEGAPMVDYITLCGSAFALGVQDAELRRHRRFEIRPEWPLMIPPCAHGLRFSTIGVYGHSGGYSKRIRAKVIGVYGEHGRDRRRTRQEPQGFPTEARREAMGIDWMTGEELTQAIPPAYTEWIGQHLIAALSTHENQAYS